MLNNIAITDFICLVIAVVLYYATSYFLVAFTYGNLKLMNGLEGEHDMENMGKMLTLMLFCACCKFCNW